MNPTAHVDAQAPRSAARRAAMALRAPLVASMLAAAAWFSATAHADTAIVIVGGNGLAFSPQTTDINAGDTVTFLNFGGVHNVVADDGSFRCAHGCDNDGHGGSGAASGQPWQVSITFPNAGTVGYFCETHGAPGVGMFGTINVAGPQPPPPPPAPSAIPLGGRWMLALLAFALVAGARWRLRR